MTIKWGDPIECNGVRPHWLRDDEPISVTYNGGAGGWANANGSQVYPGQTHFRLPADHPAYVALARGFHPWSGGESAPDDWDGGAVLLNSGDECGGASVTSWAGQIYDFGVIGYRKRNTRFDEPRLARIEVEGSARVEGVFIKRMSEAEARAFAKSHGYVGGPDEEHYVGALHDVGLIRPESRAERFTRETGHEVTEAVEAALNWKGK